MTDLSALKPTNTRVPVKITLFDGTPTDIVIFITTPLDGDFIVRKSRLANEAKIAKFKAVDGRVAGEVDLKFDLKAIAAIIVGWENLKENGVELKYSEKEAERIIEKYPLLAVQVKEAADDQSAFFTDAPKTSQPTPRNTSKRTKRTTKA